MKTDFMNSACTLNGSKKKISFVRQLISLHLKKQNTLILLPGDKLNCLNFSKEKKGKKRNCYIVSCDLYKKNLPVFLL